MKTIVTTPLARSLARRLAVPVWLLVVGLFVTVGFGFLAGRTAGSPDDEIGPVRHGVVDSVDPGSGEVCVRGIGATTVECYPAPGLGLGPGDEIGYRVGKQPVRQDDLTTGTHEVIVYIERG